MSNGSAEPVVACPICAGSTTPYCTRRAHGDDWVIRKCRACGHGFVSNLPTLDVIAKLNASESMDHTLGEFTRDAYERRADCREFARRITGLSRVRGYALDVGSGDGSYSYHLWRHGFMPVMIDLDPRAARATELMPGSTFRVSTFEDLPDAGPFGAIVMSQVLEHALGPVAWLRRAREILSPGGVLAIAVPNFGGVYRLRGAHDPFLIPPVHLNFFTARSMRLALESGGLRVARLDTQSRVPAGGSVARSAWNVASRVLDVTSWGIILRAFAINQS
ncbi:MAG: class I SAM-dependent methyltransferase [Tepidisphaeraceae bacterium]